MYYKIKDNIIFRKYNNYGYLTDNAMFGYKMPDDNRFFPGENTFRKVGLLCLSA
jgi:hypothetical protein